jgi:zinc transporter, ZIP family
MSLPQLLILGAIAGYTIFLGLPVARLRKVSETWSIADEAASAGILLFLVVDIVGQMLGLIEGAISNMPAQGAGPLAALSIVAAGGLTVGLPGLAYVSSLIDRRPDASGGHSTGALARLSQPLRLSMTIAIGIGLHNFAEGLAIGQAAAAGSISLALVLIVGFGLHNATEGFGITGPLVGQVRPSWRFLLLTGLIGGSPTFLGTLLGRSYVSDVLSVLFLALAAGSIIFVVQTVVHAGLRTGRTGIFSAGLLLGLVAGIATDLIISAAGA